jgi:CheY-like chemotaxis protein
MLAPLLLKADTKKRFINSSTPHHPRSAEGGRIMKTERLSMDSTSSVREPAGKCRWQNKKQLLPEQHASLRAVASASHCRMEPSSRKEAADASAENAYAGVQSQRTVLFVSDDDYFRTTARAYLEHVGLSVRSCADAARVPELFFRKPAIDLLLVDVHAIGTTGLLLTAELTAFSNDLPVIIISPPNGEDRTLAAISGQGWKLLSKPVLLPELLEAIHAALGRKSSPETWNTRNSPVADDDVSAGQSRCATVSTEEFEPHGGRRGCW